MIAALVCWLYMTKSGRRSEQARLVGKWYCSDRSAKTHMSSGTCSLTNSVMMCRISSCRWLYLRKFNATLQLLRTWQSVCFSPQSLHAADRPLLFLHSAIFALWGRVSFAAFKTNFIWADGSDWVAFAHTLAAVGLMIVNSLPCTQSEVLCLYRASCSSFSILFFARLETALREAPGSEAKACWAMVWGWNFARCCFSSFLVFPGPRG